MSIADLRVIENPDLVKVTVDLDDNRSLPILSHGDTFWSELEAIFSLFNWQTFTMFLYFLFNPV